MPRIPESTLQEIRGRLSLVEVAGRRTRLKRSGKAWRGGCPLHGGGETCFLVDSAKNTFHCFSCGLHGDVISFVMQSEGCDFPQAVARCASEVGMSLDLDPGERKPLPPMPERAPDAEPDRSADIARAAGWWRQAEPIGHRSEVARYLAGRNLWPLPEDAHRVLRAFVLEHPETGRALHPVMLARIDDAAGDLVAVHRTYLGTREDGVVVKRWGVTTAKLVFGPLPPGSAIRLGPVGAELGVAEGIETALAAWCLSGTPCWATISAGGMEKFVAPEGVARIVIFADRDKPRRKPWRPEGQGMHSARVLAKRAEEAGVLPRIREPLPPAADYADVLMARGRAA